MTALNMYGKTLFYLKRCAPRDSNPDNEDRNLMCYPVTLRALNALIIIQILKNTNNRNDDRGEFQNQGHPRGTKSE